MQPENPVKASLARARSSDAKPALVSIAVRDEDRIISQFWETVKKRESRRHIRACETARKIFLLGFAAYMQQLELLDEQERSAKIQAKVQAAVQGDLFRLD